MNRIFISHLYAQCVMIPEKDIEFKTLTDPYTLPVSLILLFPVVMKSLKLFIR